MAWKAPFTAETLLQILSKYYTDDEVQIDILPGFEDINVKVTILEKDQSTRLSQFEKEFVLKLSKVQKQEDLQNYDLQQRITQYLCENDFLVPKQIASKLGKLNSILTEYSENGMTVCVRALTFIPGLPLKVCQSSEKLMYDIGRTIGRMDACLEKFERGNWQQVDNKWELSRFGELKSLISRFCKGEMLCIAKEITNMFEDRILPNLNSFKKGYIHGDLACSNLIIMQEEYQKPEGIKHVCGFIDFGDICVSTYVFEIAMFMNNVLTKCRNKINPYPLFRSVLKGFTDCFPLNDAELSCLRACMCVRAVSLYVMCRKWSKEDPENNAITKHIPRARSACKYLMSISDEHFFDNVIR